MHPRTILLWDDSSVTSSFNSPKAMSLSNNNGMPAPINSVDAATISTEEDATAPSPSPDIISFAFTNWANMAPNLPQAVHTPIPALRTRVGNSSPVKMSIAFQESMENI
mmetsp:Transcript_18618/g.39143  ORF Transcript_18618/g.39143 Transcript_18618/m.39143 type:complete len:109 (-) Transcript_18618:1611-1937(-)